MKADSSSQKLRTLSRRRNRNKGFALVISLSLMVLLTILAVGLLSLSTITLRASGQEEAMQVARSNARMALNMAIGQLQKSAGADQRITAPASLVAEANPLGFTGAWKSWGKAEEGTDYDGKKDKFLGWLTSSALGQKTALDPATPPHVSPDTPGAALLLGQGTLEDRPTAAGQDARMAVKPTIVQGRNLDGHFAWASVDESMKSRLNLSAESKLSTPAKQIANVGGPFANAVRTFEGLEEFEAKDANIAKMISHGSANLQLVHDKLAKEGENKLGKLTPDLTVWASSLMTNTVDGGLKRDLSTFSSRANSLSTEEKALRLFNDAGLATGEGDPYLSSMAQFHELYKKVGTATGVPGVAVVGPPNFDPAPRDPRTRLNLPKPQALKEGVLLAPSVVRVDIIFSLITRPVHGGRAAALIAAGRPYMLHLLYLPVVTLHNPYNVPLTFDSVKVTFEDVPVGFQFTVDGQPLTNDLIPLNGLNNTADGSSGVKKDFGITLKRTIGGNTPFTLEPGQTKLFGTPKVPANWTWAKESPGEQADGTALFDWNQQRNFTANFEMVPKLITTQGGSSCGFDVDWLAPKSMQTAAGVATSGGEGIVALKGNERIGVNYGPKAPQTAGFAFSILTEVKSKNVVVKSGAIKVNYQSEKRLKEVVEEGTSERFPDKRSFPETFPKIPDDPQVTTVQLLEPNNKPVSDYKNPKPFVMFSISGKTTKESFVPNRPYADGAPAPMIANIDFSTNKDMPGDVPLEMVMMPIRGGNAPVEEDRVTEEGFFFGGHGISNGSKRATFFEIPQAPLQSLAQFRHFNIGMTGFHPNVTYTVGESLASPLIGTDKVKSTWPSNSSEMLDKIWLANAAMWDRYFLSTIADQSGTAFGSSTRTSAELVSDFLSGSGHLFNERMVPVVTGSVEQSKNALTSTQAWIVAAAYMLNEGGFNVNSVSVDAWVSVLSALREAEVSTHGGLEAGSKGMATFPRVRRPAAGSIDPATADAERRWQGYPEFTDKQIRSLAENLVKEIRERGPFLSLSEFVNRRIGSATDDRTLRGALQAAIQEAGLDDSANLDGMDLAVGNIGNHKYVSPTAAYGNNTIFAPGSLSQGDIMGVIGSHVTVRGDTFSIRCYGDASDKKSGKVIARAWCEAVVQRMPEYVDSADLPEEAGTQLTSANQAFGRRFHVKSFRWLAPEEI